jgi:hypothetical protein
MSDVNGQGDGTFGYPTTHAATGLGTRSTAVADVNGDGRLDLLAASLCGAGQCREGLVDVFLANEGTFQFSGFYHTGAFGAASIAVADLNDDGGFDVVVANEGCADAGCINGTAGVLLNSILSVRIEVRHGGPVGRVNVGSHARLRVVLFASNDFEVTRVDPATVRFGPAGAVPVRIRIEDVDRDGRLDVTFHFVAHESGIACGDSAAALTGLTEEGLRFRGTDSLVTTGCGRP